ncbi:MAG: energy transducer TonB [Candidatus Tyrphobacter sp.]
MERVHGRWFIAFGVLTVLFCAWTTRAFALTEYCPASIDDYEPASTACRCEPSALWGFRLSSLGARSVTGTIEAQTDAGWFLFAFPQTAVTAHPLKYSSSISTFVRTEYLSAPLYVRFPKPVRSIRWWVEWATASGDVAFGWDQRGAVHCQPNAGLGTNDSHGSAGTTRLTPLPDLFATPPYGTALSIASAIPAPEGWTACAQPFVPARVVGNAPGTTSIGFDAGLVPTAGVEVAVAADGHLDDAWIAFPSGRLVLDRKALNIARASRYVGGTALCQPALGRYLFVVTFD